MLLRFHHPTRANMTKRQIPDSSDAQDQSDDEVTWHCNKCDVTKPVGKFAKWALVHKQHLCRTCATARSKEAHVLRKGSLHRNLMAQFRKHLHKAGASRAATFALKLSDMEELVARQGGRSVFSGIADLERLTIGRWNNSQPWCFPNLVILSYAESREHNKRSLKNYHTTYVNHVEAHLLLPDPDAEGAPESAATVAVVDDAESDDDDVDDDEKGNVEVANQDAGSGEDADSGNSAVGVAIGSEVADEFDHSETEHIGHAPPPQQEPPHPVYYPPKNLHKGGFTSEVAMWCIRNFGIMHPTLPSSSHACRVDLVPRMDGPICQSPTVC
jgi:hypothetical protein